MHSNDAIAPPSPEALRQRHYRAGQSSSQSALRARWAAVIGAEFARQERDGRITRDILFRRLGDRSDAQFRRDLGAITKIGTRHGDPAAVPGFNRLIAFADALGISYEALSPAVAA